MKNFRDVFLCHASEDKDLVVRPLFQALEQSRISAWYDEAEIRWGESITKAVNRGLAESRYVIVILSRAFLSKNWPQRELNAVLNLEASDGEVRVLPLVLGDAHDAVLAAYPLLNDKRYLEWSGDPSPIITEFKKLLPTDEPIAGQPMAKPIESIPNIPMPPSVHTVTDREKDQFVSAAYQEIKDYFQQAITKLNEQAKGIDADFSEIDQFSFLCSFYKNGQRARQCKIWLGSHLSSTQSILYYFNHSIDPHQTSSINECLSASEQDGQLALSTHLNMNGNEDGLTPLDAAEHLWKRTIEWL